MSTPLYLCEIPSTRPEQGHHGLWFDKFFNQYSEDCTKIIETDKSKQIPEGKVAWIKTLQGSCGDRENLDAACKTQEQICKMLNGETRTFQTEWHFATGLGNPHPVENGFTWHPTLGTPYLPGSAIKGLVREWVARWAEMDDDSRRETLHRWFGSDNKKPGEQLLDNKAGQFIFFDALPESPVRLSADVMTPHMDKWYEQGGNILDPEQEPEAIPADWHNPVPVPFLVVRQAKFQFAIAPRTEQARTEIGRVMEYLAKALEFLGIGAKTAAGYGRMGVAQNLLKASGEEWQGVPATWNKGTKVLSVIHPDKRRAEAGHNEAQKIFDSLPENIQKKLLKGDKPPRLDATIEKHGERDFRLTSLRVPEQ